MRSVILVLGLLALAACTPPQTDTPASNPRLDKLFAELATAPSAAEAAPIERQIWAIWRQSGSPTVDILLERAQAAEAGGDLARARAFLDRAAEIEPDYAEIYERRAVLAARAQNPEAALADISETLKREPRHFGALTALGLIYESLGHEKAALAAYRDALKINPFLEGAKQGAARLGAHVDGQGA